MVKWVKRHSARELYCTRCKRWHRSGSKIYDEHYKYLVERRSVRCHEEIKQDQQDRGLGMAGGVDSVDEDRPLPGRVRVPGLVDGRAIANPRPGRR